MKARLFKAAITLAPSCPAVYQQTESQEYLSASLSGIDHTRLARCPVGPGHHLFSMRLVHFQVSRADT